MPNYYCNEYRGDIDIGRFTFNLDLHSLPQLSNLCSKEIYGKRFASENSANVFKMVVRQYRDYVRYFNKYLDYGNDAINARSFALDLFIPNIRKALLKQK